MGKRRKEGGGGGGVGERYRKESCYMTKSILAVQEDVIELG